MTSILVPIGGTPNDRLALQEIIKRHMVAPASDVHLINVQTPFNARIARFSSRQDRRDHHHQRAEAALAPAREMLARFSIPHAVHVESGDRAALIALAARKLGCDRIVMATARKNALTRLLQSSVTAKVMELSPVPVEVIPGTEMSRWERLGIPAAVGAGLALIAAIGD